ncbi:MAG: rRNA maturation RNase YbeY [Thermodesulfobacteriota bacterium]|nr:rRNA maturation RNase YbeY [Thermodesulfobacteriota bacterium]
MACHDRELSILFTNDDQIARLNHRYLGRKGPTNVLAFPMTNPSMGVLQGGGPMPGFESPMLGDVVISVETALRESRELGEPPEYTIDRLLIHGILHLLGHDHEKTVAEARRMQNEEDRLMSLIMED